MLIKIIGSDYGLQILSFVHDSGSETDDKVANQQRNLLSLDSDDDGSLDSSFYRDWD